MRTERIFHDKSGRLVIFQKPNPPLLIFAAGMCVAAFTHGRVKIWTGSFAFVALAVWALLEAVSGVNYFRRALGLLVLLCSVALPLLVMWLG